MIFENFENNKNNKNKSLLANYIEKLIKFVFYKYDGRD